MGYSTRVMQPHDWTLIKHFRPDEFQHPHKLGFEWMRLLDLVRERAGVPMTPTSDWRDPARKIGAKDSAHGDVPCDSTDFGKRETPSDPNWNYARWRIVKAAIECGITRIGIYPSGSLHLDKTEDERPGERLWIAVDNPAA